MFNDYYHVTDSPRCLDIRDGYVTVNVENSDFTAGKLENSKGQPITIGGYHDNSTIVNITGSTLTALADGYGIIAFCPTDLTIDNSTISGYAALFMKGPYDSHGTAGSHVTIQNNSTLKSYNDSNAETNEFSTIALEDGGISITVSNSTISAEATSTMTQSIISSNDPDPDSDYSYPGWTEATINFLSGTTLNLIGASANLYRSGGDGTHRETIQVNGVTNNDLVDILSSGDIIDIMTISSDGVINYNYTHPAEPTVIPESTPVPTFVVTFLDCDGNTVSVQSVPYQGNATAPTGYGTYVGYTDISANIDLKPTSCSAASKVKGYIIPNTADK
ncbi:MAG: hypothetical protein LKF50_07135 [Solobacterium sp.]|jgi:hypothetical protein|nr:hypothetical protein [Solobacterium sp.]